MVVLDAVLEIQRSQAPDLAVRWNCKAAKCGSCSAEVNGKPRLMCKTRLDHLPADEPITVEPMRAFPVIRDLVTDVSWNYEVNKQITPFTPREDLPDGDYLIDQADTDRMSEFRKCIECFMCQDVCHVLRDHRLHDKYYGPRFMVRLASLDMHPLDGDRPHRPDRRRGRHRPLQHHQVLHRGLPRGHPHHRQRDHPAEGARRRRALRPAAQDLQAHQAQRGAAEAAAAYRDSRAVTVAGHPAGRFAPSPSGPLHLGSLRTALVAWLMARGAGARFLVRIEDLDPQRSRPEFIDSQLADLSALGIDWDEPPVRQSQRLALYDDALGTLHATGRLYPCFCTRAEIREAASAPHGELPEGRLSRHLPRAVPRASGGERIEAGERFALRLRADAERIEFEDALLGPWSQVVDDFVVVRADGVHAYQLAVVVDDAAQGIGQVVRGADLADSTPRQILLQRLLGLPTPSLRPRAAGARPGGRAPGQT